MTGVVLEGTLPVTGDIVRPGTEASDVLSTLNEDGSRRWLRPRPSRGRFLTARRAVAYVLILVFTLIPYLRLNGRPLVLLDLSTRHFTILGATFLPTDTLLLALFLVGTGVTIFLLTALLGRVWCGWACPQTVYMEFVFRPIERLFDGGAGRRGRLGGGALLKYAVYLLVSLYLAHTFLAYFVGVEKLAVWVRQSPFDHPGPFLVMLVTTALMMFDFCYFREQTCIVACPYGRFQSVLLDRQSLIVTYDEKRGEPRGRPHRGTPAGAPGDVSLKVVSAPGVGDCVDCGMCVTTCPTGIDIRRGLQMECIGCAQCIDACDAVMTKVGRAVGLIRYSSQATMGGEPKRLLRPRVVIYPLVLGVILTAFVTVLVRRAPADVTVLRGLGAPFTEMGGGEIGNQMRVKVVNRADSSCEFRVEALGVAGLRLISEGNPVALAPGESKTTPAMIVAPLGAFTNGACDVTVRVTGAAGFVKEVRYRMMGPGSSHRGAPAGGKEAP